MKNLFNGVILAAVLAAMSGCQRSEAPAVQGETVEASFFISLDGLVSKAYSDGLSATSLQALVYSVREGGYKFLPNVSVTDATISGSTRLSLRLVKGETYEIVFWAQNPDGPYSVDAVSGTMKVNPSGPANAEQRDAFYKTWTGKVAESINERVELRRPFAQINVLTSAADYAAALDNEIAFSGSSMKVSAPTVLDFHTGKTSVPAAYDLSAAPLKVDAPNVPGYEDTVEGGVTVANYKYVAMNYILAGDRTNTQVLFSVYREGSEAPLYDYSVLNVPYQRNYRTNILGDIFSVDGVFDIVIIPEYEEPQNSVNI